MAGIDKTYISGKEYSIYRKWWIDNYDKMVKEFGEAIWLSTFSIFDDWHIDITPEYLKNNKQDIVHYETVNKFPIWNTDEKVDKWLIKNCNIASFRKRMLDVYGSKWNGFKQQK